MLNLKIFYVTRRSDWLRLIICIYLNRLDINFDEIL